MRKNSSRLSAEPATLLKNLRNILYSLSFRLTLRYAGIFTVSLFAAFITFYTLVLHGSHNVLDIFSPLIEVKGLRTELHAEGPLVVMADAQKIQRVLSNLVDNAIRYTGQGGSIGISTMGTDQEVRIVVKDNGVGIPDSELRQIFDRFFRGEKSRSEPGSGLGLSLARALVAAHKGRISVTSAPGQGASFVVTLPKAQSRPA